jgi:hypothetical protein
MFVAIFTMHLLKDKYCNNFKVRCEGGDQSGDQSKETGANAGQEGSGEQNGRQKQRVHLCRANKLKDAHDFFMSS